jgi:predicted RecB family nuclease
VEDCRCCSAAAMWKFQRRSWRGRQRCEARPGPRKTYRRRLPKTWQARPRRLARREFSETLLLASERFPGAIMAWSQYEERVIRDMAGLFPDLAERLIALLYRIVDLLKIVQDHVAHPDFQGSYSMKAVAPALAPDLTYGDLDIADGGAASAAFYRIVADPTLSAEARNELRRSLLVYCQRDTLALARVHQWLIQER